MSPRRLRSRRSSPISRSCSRPASGFRRHSSRGSGMSPRCSADMNRARSVVDCEAWEREAQRLHSGECSLVGLWGEPGFAHIAVMEVPPSAFRVLSIACEANRFPAIGRLHPPAIRLARAVRDLAGLEADGSPDTRPWLHHTGPYRFLPVEGESLHQIPVGPVHAGIIEPGHFRFTANGETVVRLEERLRYVHKR